MALRWKKEPAETGLRSVCAGPRSSKLWDGETEFASVYAHSTRHTGKTGWYWVASGGGIPYNNTCGFTGESEQDAKAEAMAYVKKHLALASPK
jgi:hypothetical protein